LAQPPRCSSNERWPLPQIVTPSRLVHSEVTRHLQALTRHAAMLMAWLTVHQTSCECSWRALEHFCTLPRNSPQLDSSPPPVYCTVSPTSSLLPDSAILRVAPITLWVTCQSPVGAITRFAFHSRGQAHGYLVASRNASIGQHRVVGSTSSSPKQRHRKTPSVSSDRTALCLELEIQSNGPG
jgi:hypothetical protein